MADAREELRIDSQAAVHGVPRPRNQAHRKFVLKHDDRSAEGGTVRQQLKGERRGYLVGDVGHADVKVGQVCLHHVCLDHLRLQA